MRACVLPDSRIIAIPEKLAAQLGGIKELASDCGLFQFDLSDGVVGVLCNRNVGLVKFPGQPPHLAGQENRRSISEDGQRLVASCS